MRAALNLKLNQRIRQSRIRPVYAGLNYYAQPAHTSAQRLDGFTNLFEVARRLPSILSLTACDANVRFWVEVY